MSEALQAVFGGSEKESSSKPIDLQSPELAAVRAPFAQTLVTSLQQGGRPAYEGDLVAPITQAEQDQLAILRQGTGNQPLLDATKAGAFLPGGAQANPFLEAAIRAAQNPTRQALNDTLSRTLPGVFTRAGQQIGGGLRSPNPRQQPGSTAFDLAAARAFEGGAGALSDIATNMSYQGYNDERARQQATISLSQQELDSSIKNLQAQALPRLIQDLGIERGLAEFQSRAQALTQLLSILAGATAPVVGNVQKSTETSQKGIIPGLAGTVALPPGAPR